MATQQIKDILDTEVPKPSFVLSPSVPAPLPSGVTHTRNGQDNVARTLDPYSGKFEHVPEDTPRVYGSDQSLLVEDVSRTNHVPYSSNVRQWGYNNNHTEVSGGTSLLKGETAYEVSNSGGKFDTSSQTAGSFSGSREAQFWIIERGTSDTVLLQSFDTDKPGHNYQVFFIWNNEVGNRIVVNNQGLSLAFNDRVLTQNGPNGGEVAVATFRYDPYSSGNTRAMKYNPDTSGLGNTTYIHHAQVEEAANTSSPIVTQSSSNTRAKDKYTIFSGGQPEWWNENQGTFFLEIEPQYYYIPDFTNIIRFAENGNFLGSLQNNLGVNYALNFSSNFGFGGTPFVRSKVAFAFDGPSSEMRISKDGSSKKANGVGGLAATDVFFDGTQHLISKLVYYPRALPESTLNTLTT